VQSALGNLPELFIGLFALRAGLVEVVRASLIGSILANSLLVLGLALIQSRKHI
jgi:Ca2+:H+ antiporter